MADPRVQKLARVLVHYSLALKPGDKARIGANTISLPLVREVYREAIRAGALVTVRFAHDDLDEIRLREASEEQLGYVSELTRQENDYFDAILSIWGEENTKSLSGVDPRRIAVEQQARGPLLERMLARMASGELRWCGTQFPTQASAQDAGMSLSEYEDFVYGAGHLDLDDPAAEWRRIAAEQQRIADFLQQHDEIHIVAPGTDLTYRVGGRIWSNAAGRENFPDGEIYSGPIEDSVNGTVAFTYPAVYHGNEVEQVRLRFENGKAVEHRAVRDDLGMLPQLGVIPTGAH
jgi:aminopeptidase